MKVILMSIENFNTVQLEGVTNIAYNASTKTYTITHSGGSSSYPAAAYHINILW